MAIEEADNRSFICRCESGVTDRDADIAKTLRRSDKPVVVVSNKADNFELGYQSSEFYALGLGDPFSVSAINGSGTGDLLDHIFTLFEEDEEEEDLTDIP